MMRAALRPNTVDVWTRGNRSGPFGPGVEEPRSAIPTIDPSCAPITGGGTQTHAGLPASIHDPRSYERRARHRFFGINSKVKNNGA